jgi:hypothetical protein
VKDWAKFSSSKHENGIVRGFSKSNMATRLWAGRLGFDSRQRQ